MSRFCRACLDVGCGCLYLRAPRAKARTTPPVKITSYSFGTLIIGSFWSSLHQSLINQKTVWDKPCFNARWCRVWVAKTNVGCKAYRLRSPNQSLKPCGWKADNFPPLLMWQAEFKLCMPKFPRMVLQKLCYRWCPDVLKHIEEKEHPLIKPTPVCWSVVGHVLTNGKQSSQHCWLSKAPHPFCSWKFPLIFLKFPLIFLKFPLIFLKFPSNSP